MVFRPCLGITPKCDDHTFLIKNIKNEKMSREAEFDL